MAASIDIDDVLDKLLQVRKRVPTSQNVTLATETVETLCQKVRGIFSDQDMLLELEAPLSLCGDVHGQYHDLLRIFDMSGYPPQANYLFLGDYVDRGKKSTETIFLLFAYKVKYPESFFLLRGNHECEGISRLYGFYDECKQRYSVKIWKTCCDVFNYMPACAIIDDRVICMHGGLSRNMDGMDNLSLRQAINGIDRPAGIPDLGLFCDLLWSDPWEGSGYGTNERGVSETFGVDVVQRFLANQHLDLIVRAHQVMEDGFQFFAGRGLVTIFSAPNYCGDYDNAAVVLTIDADLQCSFLVLKPTPGSIDLSL